MLRKSFLFFLLAAIGFAVFGQVYSHDLLYWDDLKHICQNRAIFPGSTASFLDIWRGPYFDLYVPVSYSLWSLLVRIGEVFGFGDVCTDYGILFHLANVSLHILNSFLVFVFVRTIIGRSHEGREQVAWAGAFAALLFLLHPLQVESVAWASGLRDLSAITISVTLLICYFREETISNFRYTVCFLMFLVALLAKPNVAIVPGIITAIDILVLKKNIKSSILRLLPWFGSALAIAFWTSSMQVTANSSNPNLLQRVELMFFSFGFYLFKVIFPVHLAPDYGFPVNTLLGSAYLPIIAAATLLVLSGILISLWLRAESIFFLSLTVFLISLIPVSGLFNFSFQGISQVADRYTDFAMLGFAFASAEYFLRVKSGWVRAVSVAIAVLFGILSFKQVEVWKSDLTLFSHSVKVVPEASTAQGNLGNALYRMGELKQAELHLKESLRIDPENKESAIILGHVLEHQGRNADAIGFYRGIIASGRNWPIIHNNLGYVLMTEGDTAAAEKEYLSAAELDSGFFEPRFNLGAIYLHFGRLSDSKRFLDEAYSINPQLPELNEDLLELRRRMSR